MKEEEKKNIERANRLAEESNIGNETNCNETNMDQTNNQTTTTFVNSAKPLNYDDLAKKFDTEEPISTFIDRMKWSGESKAKKIPHKSAKHTITYPELSHWYWEEVDRRKKNERLAKKPKFLSKDKDQDRDQNPTRKSAPKSIIKKRKRNNLANIQELDENQNEEGNDSEDDALYRQQEAIFREIEKVADIDDDYEYELPGAVLNPAGIDQSVINPQNEPNATFVHNDKEMKSFIQPPVNQENINYEATDREDPLNDDDIYGIQPAPENIFNDQEDHDHFNDPPIDDDDFFNEDKRNRDDRNDVITHGNHLDDDFDNIELDFDNLVRKHVDEYYNLARRFANESEMDKRVREWSDKLAPYLEEITSNKRFDLHGMADQVLKSLDSTSTSGTATTKAHKKRSRSTSGKKRPNWTKVLKPLQESTDTKPENLASQRFWALLQLANNGNVEISPDFSVAGTESFVDNLRVRLIKGDRLQERFDDMEV